MDRDDVKDGIDKAADKDTCKGGRIISGVMLQRELPFVYNSEAE